MLDDFSLASLDMAFHDENICNPVVMDRMGSKGSSNATHDGLRDQKSQHLSRHDDKGLVTPGSSASESESKSESEPDKDNVSSTSSSCNDNKAGSVDEEDGTNNGKDGSNDEEGDKLRGQRRRNR